MIAGAPARVDKGPMLIWTIASGAKALLERDLFWALLLRNHGYDATMVLCDGSLGVCILNNAVEGKPVEEWSTICKNCKKIGQEALEQTGIPYLFLGDLLTGEAIREAETFAKQTDARSLAGCTYLGTDLYRNAISALSRYARSSYTVSVEQYERHLPAFVRAACLSASAADACIKRMSPEMIFLSHGIYAEWGPMVDVAMKNNIPVCRNQGGFLRNSNLIKVLAQSASTSPLYLEPDEWDTLRSTPIRAKEPRELDDFVLRYKTGDNSRQQFFSGEKPDREQLRKKLNLPADKPVWCIFPHLVWDAQMSSGLAYSDITEWLRDTCRIIAEDDAVHWVIKVHPSERLNATEYGAQNVVEDYFRGNLPANLTFLPPDFTVNTYYLHELLHGGITIRGSAGLELALLGKPVVTVGEGHYAGKGFTHDCKSVEEYRTTLRRISTIQALSKEQHALARKYAHYYFCERQIQIDFTHELESRPSHADFAPGADAFHDTLLASIMRAKESGLSCCVGNNGLLR